MEEFKEFRGKSLDEAIQGACVYYDALREKLEIEIVQDAKSGIFGLVGVRKAIIRARRARVRPQVGNLLGRSLSASPPAGGPQAGGLQPGQTLGRPASALKPDQGESADSLRRSREDLPMAAIANGRPDARNARTFNPKDGKRFEQRPELRSEQRPDLQSEQRPAPSFRHAASPEKSEKLDTFANQRKPKDARMEDSSIGSEDTSWPSWDELSRERGTFVVGQPLSKLDQSALHAATLQAAEKMVTAILGETPMDITILEHRVDVRVDCGSKSGLLIGREGQTLSALQYLASRMVSRNMEAPVRVQFDVGDYRERQDERLRDLALALAERVRQTGRPCSTRPMSSYHRRLVHLALQDAPDILTRSSGEGPLKRIVVQRRRPERTDRAERPVQADQPEQIGQTDL